MCSICDGYFGVVCPVCGSGAREERKCPECEGLGHKGYYAFDIHKRVDVKCTEIAWMVLPDSEDEAFEKGKRYCKQEVEPCCRCGGDGFIMV